MSRLCAVLFLLALFVRPAWSQSTPTEWMEVVKANLEERDAINLEGDLLKKRMDLHTNALNLPSRCKGWDDT